MSNRLFFRKTFAVLCGALILPFFVGAQGRCRALRDSVEIFINTGLYYKADQLAKSVRLMDICREEFGEADTVFANVLTNLSTIRYFQGDHRTAMALTMRADSIYQKSGFTHVQDYGSVCNNLAAGYKQLGKLRIAEQYARRAIEISRLNGDSSSSMFGNRLNSLSTILVEQGKYEEGVPVVRAAMHLLEVNGDTSTQVYLAQALNLARVYDALGLYDSSVVVANKMLPITEEVWKSHPYRPLAWIARANARYRLGRILAALEDYEQALLLCQDKNYFFAEALNGKALCLTALGSTDEALVLQLEAIELAQKFMGKDYLNLSAFWNNLGFIYRARGDIEKAMPALLEGQRVLENKVGKTQRNALDLQNNIATFQIENGFYEQALVNMLETERNCREVYGTETPFYALTLNNLSAAYAYLGERDSSFEKTRQSFSITQRLAKGHTAELALSLLNMSRELYEHGQVDSAFAFALRSLSEFQAIGDTSGTNYVRVLHSLMSMHYQTKQRSLARAFNERIIAHLAAHPQPDNPMYIQHVQSAALYADWFGDIPKALRLFLRTDALLDAAAERLGGLYGYGADEAFARNYAPTYEAIADVMFRHRRRYPEAAGMLYDNTLALNHLLLHQTRSALESARNSPDTATVSLARRWNDLRQLVVNQSAKVRHDFPLDSLERELSATESRLTAAYLPLYQARKKINWQAVQAALDPGDAAIEFVRLPSARDSSVRYIALLLRPGWAQPEIVDLCDETALATLLGRRVRSLPHTLAILYRSNKKNKPSEAHDLLWRPLEKRLKGVRRIYFAPAGLLHQLAFGAIEDANGMPLAERFLLEQLTSTRELAFPRPPLPGSTVQSAMLFGGIAYRSDSTALAEAGQRVACEAPGQTPLPGVAETQAAPLAPDFLPPGTRGGAICSDTLPGTAREQQTLAKILAGTGIPTQTHSGSDALEQHVKCCRPQGQRPPGLLHIGTHGIYLPPAEKKVNRPGDTFRWAENPMFRSYLVMAGGGGACAGGHVPIGTRDDGLLTAYEIAALNFEGTQLVTLSACVSALGDLRDAEGVYGLQRAFKIAGARHLLLTLWPVDDAATQAFMEAFYRRWIVENLDVREAFRRTQTGFRADPRYAHPYYWAGFVLI